MRSTSRRPTVRVDEERYGPIYVSQHRSPTLRRLFTEAYGEDHPAEIEPFGFVTWSDLHRFQDLLDLSPGEHLVDIGCGRGGPGLWLAQQAGASLTGLDLVAEAIEQCEPLRRRMGVDVPCRFAVGSFTGTGLADRSVDKAMSVDALWMVVDKPAAVDEVARVLRPGGRFVFSTWVPARVDYPALLTEAGLQVTSFEEAPDWYDRQVALYARVVSEADALRAELGEEAADVFVSEASTTPEMLATTPRVLVAARAA